MAALKRIFGTENATQSPVSQVVHDTRKALQELELSQEPLRKALDDAYPFTGPLRNQTRKRGKRAHRPQPLSQ